MIGHEILHRVFVDVISFNPYRSLRGYTVIFLTLRMKVMLTDLSDDTGLVRRPRL